MYCTTGVTQLAMYNITVLPEHYDNDNDNDNIVFDHIFTINSIYSLRDKSNY